MINFLQKQNYIALIPSQDTYFYKANLPKSIKLSKELLQLNYESHSPFKPKEIIAIEERTNLLLWFCKSKITAPIAIPEDYLLYLILKKQYTNTIVLLETTKFTKVIVIKNDQLENLFLTNNINKSFLHMCRDEYGVEEVVTYTKEQYTTLLQNSQKHLSLSLLYKFFRVDLQPKEIAKKVVEKVSYPLSFLLLFTMAINFYHNSTLEKKINLLTGEYKSLQQKNQHLINTLQKHNKQVKFYKAFIAKELSYPDPFVILEKLYKVTEEEKGSSLYMLLATQGKLSVKIQTPKSPVELLNKLSSINEFKSVLLGTTYRPRSQAPIYTYNIELKPIGVEQ